MVAPHSSQTKRAHELTRDKFVATVHKINSKKLTTKELFLLFKHLNGGVEEKFASLLMIRKVFNKKNPVAPSTKLAMLMERGLGMPRGNLIMNAIKRLQMGGDSAAKVQVEGNEVKSSCSAVVEDSSVEDNCVEDSVEVEGNDVKSSCSAVVDDSSAEDNCVEDCVQVNKVRLFAISKETMRSTCEALSIGWRENANLESRPEPPVGFTIPVSGRGSCLFKAFSMAIAGTEQYHVTIREKVCDHMINELSESLKPHIPLRYNSSVIEYVKGSKMRNSKTWGTDVEIMAFSDMVNLCVRVYKTMDCDPQLFVPGCTIELQSNCYVINLVNLNNRNVHFDVIV